MFVVELTSATAEYDTLSVYEKHGDSSKIVDWFHVQPTGKALDYEKAMTDNGWNPTEFLGEFWTVESMDH